MGFLRPNWGFFEHHGCDYYKLARTKTSMNLHDRRYQCSIDQKRNTDDADYYDNRQ